MARSLPPDAPIRVVGDVHGDAVAFAYAAATDRFVVQLGDLTDYGPDNAEALRIMFRLIDEGRGLFLLGNHDLKLARLIGANDVGESRGGASSGIRVIGHRVLSHPAGVYRGPAERTARK